MPKNAFSETRRTETSLTDFTGGLSVIGAAQIVEDAVCDFFHSFGFDNPALRKNHNSIWVFTKNRIDFENTAEWGELVTAECRISKQTAATVWVDTRLVKEDGKTVAFYARTEICAIDLEKQAIKRLSSVGFPQFDVKEDYDKRSFTRFSADNSEKVRSFKVLPSSIDYSDHTNNVEYIRFAIDSLSCGEISDRGVAAVEAHYLKQTREGDILDIACSRVGNEVVFDMTGGNIKVAACRLTFKK
ncbi:MAG: hypothetical protein J5762_00685 [Clostridia bacterium]|nr:hypothetical protein [Clostridia bacterium]